MTWSKNLIIIVLIQFYCFYISKYTAKRRKPRSSSTMADRNRQPYKPLTRRSYNSSSSSSYSNSTKSDDPNRPEPSNPNSNSSRVVHTKKTITTSHDSDRSSRNDNDDSHQDFPALVGTCPFMCPGILIIPLFYCCWIKFFFLAIVELVLVAVEERVRRERLRDLAVFERLHGDPAKTSSTLAVKKVL